MSAGLFNDPLLLNRLFHNNMAKVFIFCIYGNKLLKKRNKINV